MRQNRDRDAYSSAWFHRREPIERKRIFGRQESGAYTIPDGKSIHFGYRILLHRGDTASADIATAFAAYANPPKIDVRTD